MALNYQHKRKNPYKINHSLRMRADWLFRDYNRLKDRCLKEKTKCDCEDFQAIQKVCEQIKQEYPGDYNVLKAYGNYAYFSAMLAAERSVPSWSTWMRYKNKMCYYLLKELGRI